MRKLIGGGTAAAVLIATWPSAAIAPCDLANRVTTVTCSVEPPELAHDERDRPDPVQHSIPAGATATGTVPTASAASFFGFAESGEAAGFNQAPFFR